MKAKNCIQSFIYLIFITTCLSLLADDDSKWRFNTNEKIISVGDIHGAYDAFVGVLQKAKVIDANNNWIAGKTHFVNTGDILDRGPHSRKVMDLLMKMEQQAEQAGGKVHILLGNHEVMNLIGDYRYVSKEEYAAFIEDERASERKKELEWYTNYRNSRSETGPLNDQVLKADFEKMYPPGFFGLHRAFSPKGKYGQWLNDKPILIVINSKVMVHGGLSKTAGNMGLSGINYSLVNEIKQYAKYWYWLIDNGLFKPYFNRSDRIQMAKRLLNGDFDGTRLDKGAIKKRAREFLEIAENSIMQTPESPTWYRGSAQCHQYSELPLLESVLEKFNANSVFVGHTVTFSKQVESRFGGKVYLQDSGMLNSHYRGQASLLIHEGNRVHVFDERNGLHEIKEQSSRNWHRPYEMSVEELEDFLRTAEIVDSKDIGMGISKPSKLTLRKGNRTIHAVYKNIDTHPRMESKRWLRENDLADRYHHDIAAYELDKLLQLDMVPPAVERRFKGKKGVVQYWLEDGITQTGMIQDKIKYDGNCSKKSQLSVMKIFDALVYNDDRNTGNIFYQKDGWHLWLIDHSRAFPAKTGLPPKTKWNDLYISKNFRERLKGLNEKELNSRLKDVLHKRQISYILRRRDAILSKVEVR